MNIKLLLASALITTGFFSTAQDAGNTYAITGNGTGDFMWMNIRQIDINSGKVIRDLYQRNVTSFVMLDADTKKPVENNVSASSSHPNPNMVFGNLPTASMVAALAYDRNHEKLFFTPMRIGELRWLDLSAKGDVQKFYSLQSPLLSNVDLLTDESNHITRMVIGADGNGYAVTNDANHLYRFTTGKKVTLTDLGSLVDAESNKGISVHNKCTSWGGDMIADAYNQLYIITANHNIFSLDASTRIATHIGTITGLPANFSTNGAAVDNDGNIVLSSANAFEGYYKIKITDFAAVKIEGSDKTYNASDLANGNLLFQKEADAAKKFNVVENKPIVPALNADAHVFPNPVTNNEFKILFDGQKAGQYNVALTDLSGKTIMNKVITVSVKGQVETVRINSSIGKGMYMVKVTDSENKFIFTERIVVQ